jgi:hypothetical protein
MRAIAAGAIITKIVMCHIDFKAGEATADAASDGRILAFAPGLRQNHDRPFQPFPQTSRIETKP